ncbi:MAG TPA: ATP synthase F1 subunit delta [Terriglobales bacterium]|nr:ATP synthase F1 subunit delta [Terriglobales bacterium]
MAEVTRTYARAFADVLFDKKLDAAKVTKELNWLVNTLRENDDLRHVWQNPAIPAEQKRDLLDAIVAQERISRPVRNFLAVLIDHRRIALLPKIAQHFEEEINGRLGFAEADITSARELNDREKHALEAQLEKAIGQRIKARYARDRNILGGVIVKVGSTIYDGSVLGQLLKLRQQMVSGSG